MRVIFELTILEKLRAARQDALFNNKKIDRIFLTKQEVDELRITLSGNITTPADFAMGGPLPKGTRVYDVLVEADPNGL